MRNYQQALLDPEKCTLLIIDHQPQMYFGVESKSRAIVMNNTLGLAKAANLFQVPTILTTVAAKTFSGKMIQKLTALFPDQTPIDRTFINAWEDEKLKSAVEKTNRKKILISGLWTEACVLFPALCMTSDGYDVYAVVDACAGASRTAHDTAIMRMVQAGVKPVTWQEVMFEWQRDWNNKDTYNGIMQIAKEHSGAYGCGIEYAETFIPQN